MPSTPTRRSARRSKRPTPLLLTSLPDELLLAVIERLAALRLLRSLSSLQGASRHFYTLVTPALYHTIRLGRSGYPFTQTGILHVFDHLSLADCITAACGQDEIEAAMKDRHPLDVGRPYRIRWSLTLVKRLILGNVITKYAEEAAMDEGSFHLIATMLGLTVIDPLVYLHPPHLTSTATTNGDEQRDLLRLKSMARQIYISKRAEANDWRAEAEKIFDERVEWLLPSDAAFTGTCPICHDDLDTICDGEDTY
ncbi:hypothetical protein Q5752_002972 [Cryptotrichosporon argae]